MLVGSPALLLVTAGGNMAWHLILIYKLLIVGVKTLDKGQTHLLVLCMVEDTVEMQV